MFLVLYFFFFIYLDKLVSIFFIIIITVMVQIVKNLFGNSLCVRKNPSQCAAFAQS